MEPIKDLSVWKELRASFPGSSQVGFVPTMGALHLGHKSLLERCRNENQITVASIFVNPTQFNNRDDLDRYPITLEDDLRLAKKSGVDFVLYPSYKELYKDNYQFKIVEKDLSSILCGQHRPGHFDGVLTVVMKLFNLVQPQRAYFGEKDFQQLLLVRQMVEAFFMNIDIVACPTVREHDGLALSSRNKRLSQAQRDHAHQFPEALSAGKSCHEVIQRLTGDGFEVDYVEEHFGRRLGAVRLGEVRLIDNVKL